MNSNVVKMLFFLLYISFSIGQEITLLDSTIFSDQLGDNLTARITSVNENIHIVWHTSYPEYRLYYTHSLDGGLTWSEYSIISIGSPCNFPQILAQSDTLHITWREYGDYNWMVKYIRSTDNGFNWEEPIQYSGVYSLGGPLFGSVSDKIYLLFQTSEFMNRKYLVKSFDRGSNWGEVDTINFDISESTTSFGFNSMNLENSNIHLVGSMNSAQTLGEGEIIYIGSSDDGMSFSSPTIISPIDGATSQKVVGKLDSELNLHTVWYDYQNSPNTLHGYILHRSLNYQGIWSSTHVITNEPTGQLPSIDIDDNRISVIYSDIRDTGFTNNSQEIYYNSSSDNGETWNDDIRISFMETYNNIYPDISISNYLLYSIWSSTIVGNDYQIILKPGVIDGIKGDINQDHQQNIFDIIIYVDRILGHENNIDNLYESWAVDLFEDNHINIQDIIILLNMILNIQ
ncbi:MAG: hypothetical protein HOK29_12530 [Candidatus Marinimicrobia bacterium]|nr:hypothetical protein [Candidatus Neomarinimicrobiota bacterium]